MNLLQVQDDLKGQYMSKLFEKKQLEEQLEQINKMLTKLEGGSEIVAALQSQQEREDEEKAKAEEAEEAVLGDD